MQRTLPGSLWRWVGLSLALAAMVGCQSTAPEQDTKPTASAADLTVLSFDDTVTLDNGRVRLGVSPSVGRVVDFGFTGRDNLIWINTQAAYADTTPGTAVDNQRYANLGGDKLWPTTQKFWGAATGNEEWPPDGVLDGGGWQLIDQSADSLTIQSPVSPHYGVTVLRSFTLTPGKPQVVIQNVIQRVEANPFPVAAWTITQVKTPNAAVLDIAVDRPAFGDPVVMLADPHKIEGRVETLGQNEAAAWDQTGDAFAKLGSFGAWVAAVYDDVTFLQETDFFPAGAYPDASSAQLYRAADYTELELWSPTVQLAPGESLANKVTWTLVDVPAKHAYATLLSHDRN